MANDFKRMWTKEDINKNAVNLKDIGVELLYDGSLEITKEQYDYLSGSMFVTAPDGLTYYPLASHKWANIDFEDGILGMIRIIEDVNGKYLIDHVSGQIVTSYLYEELVKAIPTDVSIIEDQGKLELMLEHDGNVLAVNDTPNQFLQRRLDKPSAEWNSETSQTDLKSWLEEKLPSMYVGQVISFNDDSEDYYNFYCIITGVSIVEGFSFNPLVSAEGAIGIPLGGGFRLNDETINITEFTIQGSSTQQLAFMDIKSFKLF